MVPTWRAVLGRNSFAMQSTPADYNGVMGGFANLSQIDIDFSNTFIQSLRSMMPEFKLGSVLDCGAGVGRIAKDFLRHLFPTVLL